MTFRHSVPLHRITNPVLVCLFALATLYGQTNPLSLSYAGHLDSSHWETNTPVLMQLARTQSNPSSRLVAPQLAFDGTGMTMAGVNGTYQFTGLQSKVSFKAPFSVRVIVKGTVANGNPFSFLIVSADLQQFFRIEGNINQRNGPYYGLWTQGGDDNGTNILPYVRTGVWYGLTISVDENGAATATVSDSNGAALGSRTDAGIGNGPFYVVLGQREGQPYTVGPNSAVWSTVELLPPTVANAPQKTNPNANQGIGEPGIIPIVTAMSPISSRQIQEIVVLGHGFGTLPPYNGDSDFIQLSDVTRNWNAGHSGNAVSLIVAEWTDSKIVLQGFSGSYGGGWSLSPRDVVVLQVWNAQSRTGPASYRGVVKLF